MAADGPEIEDHRRRLLVELAAAPDEALRAALERLAAVDRLAAIISAPSPDLAAFAAALPTALLVMSDVAPETGSAGMVVRLDGDGATVLGAVRRRWGPSAIVVADVGSSHHAAMEAGEHGADAILFTGTTDEVCDCLDWWSELFVLPTAARAMAGEPAALDDAVRLLRAGADFLLIDGHVLASGAVPIDAMIEALAAAEALSPLPTARNTGQR